jgi:enoyl-CoA hydratase/carnithine racemase
MEVPPLLLQPEPSVGTVILNQPEVHNALNEAMQRALPPMLEQRRWRRSLSQQALDTAVSRAIAAAEE